MYRKVIPDDSPLAFYPKITPSAQDVVAEFAEYTSLDQIAYQFYGDHKLWWVIVSANDLESDTIFLKGKRILRIPMPITRVLREIKETNSYF